MTIPRALLVWLWLFVAAFTNGAPRTFVYSSWLAEPVANRLTCGIGIGLFAVSWTRGTDRLMVRLRQRCYLIRPD